MDRGEKDLDGLGEFLEEGLAYHTSGTVAFEDPERENTGRKNLKQALLSPEKHSPVEVVYTFGGVNSFGSPNNLLWTLRFDGLVYTMRMVNSIGMKPSPRYSHCMTVLEPQNVLVIYGGKSEGQSEFYNDLFVFVPESATWSKVDLSETTPLPQLAGGAIAGFGNEVFVFGGSNQQGYAPFEAYCVTLRREKNLQVRLKQKFICLR
jgi:hypothetical protein